MTGTQKQEPWRSNHVVLLLAVAIAGRVQDQSLDLSEEVTRKRGLFAEAYAGRLGNSCQLMGCFYDTGESGDHVCTRQDCR